MKQIVMLLMVLSYASAVYCQDTAKPATVQQVKEAVDWETMPLLPDASKIQKRFNHMSFQAPGTYEQAAEFYRQQLTKLGWKEDTSVASDQKNYLSVVLEKNGFRLSVSGYRTKPEEPMAITLMNFGNVDVSQFPKADDADVKTSNKGAVYYFTKQPADAVVKFCREFMTKQGWKEEVNDMFDTWAKEGRFVLQFRQNAIECTLVIVKKADQSEVTYTSGIKHDMSASEVASTVSTGTSSKPGTMKEAMQVINIMKLPRMEKAAKAKFQKELVSLPIGTAYQVPDSLEDAVKFYRQQMKAAGFTELTPMVETDTLALLYFEKKGYLLHFSAQRDKKEGVTELSLMNHGNVDIRKLPMPEGAKVDPERYHFMNLTTSLSLGDTEAFYRKELTKLGWKEAEQQGKGLMRFTQNAVVLRLEIQKNTYNKTAVKIEAEMR